MEENTGLMKKFTDKRAQAERAMKRTYEQIDHERSWKCEVCPSKSFEHSHNFPKGKFPQWIAAAENITLLCRQHHLAWENSRLWELNPVVITRVLDFMTEIEDENHFKLAYAHFTTKLYKMVDIAKAEGVELPPFCIDILNTWEIEWNT